MLQNRKRLYLGVFYGRYIKHLLFAEVHFSTNDFSIFGTSFEKGGSKLFCSISSKILATK
jgi:hypothetical protein